MWAYSRCNYRKVIHGDTDKQDWKDHMRLHFREDDGDIPYSIRCWFKECGEVIHTSSNDPEEKLVHLDNYLEHTLKDFRKKPWLSVHDLRDDDIDMIMTAWINNEIWDAYYDPRIPAKQDERLPEELFDEFARRIDEQGYDPTRRDLISYVEVEQEKKA
jgi:hypothetical protein